MAVTNDIRAMFFEECEDLLEALTEGLGRIEGGARDPDTVNAVFRAVHSIKGGAGAFALSALVAFAHRFETALDGLRSQQNTLTAEGMTGLMRAADHLARLIEAARDGFEVEAATTRTVMTQLDAVLGLTDTETDLSFAEGDPCLGFAAVRLDLDLPLADDAHPAKDTTDDLPDAAPSAAAYLIRFRPLPRLYANGHDPALILSALADLGEVVVTLDVSGLPDWTAFDPAGSYLSWTLHLTTTEPETVLHELFEFVEGLCELEITPTAPSAAVPQMTALSQLAAPEMPGPGAPTQLPADDTAAIGPKPTLRVDLDRVDRLINAVGELIINQAMIEQRILGLSLPSDADLLTHLEEYRLLARDIQEAVMAIRAQPVKPLFQRMSRILREAAEATGKQARLITVGDTVEIDKTVIERLADPLTHMIRNAVDHGLESAADRLAAGKLAVGSVRLSAAHRSGHVIISVCDDGAGLNRAQIRNKAVARGLIAPDADLAEAEIDNLLFHPGFSTADAVSNLSGRGVGLDVVKTAITALGGRVSISSTPGAGTEFTLSLPLTLAVMDGMVISVAGRTMVVPVASVTEAIRPKPADLHRFGPDDTMVLLRGCFVPMIDVARALGLPAKEPSEPPLILLVETDGQMPCALVIDAVHDQRQVVIKGLATNYGAIPGISAATVLGDGQIALILDTDALVADRRIPLTAKGHPHVAA
ncbi:MAG: chemotaxis protein CheA [Paracoccaceae bacterium]